MQTNGHYRAAQTREPAFAKSQTNGYGHTDPRDSGSTTSSGAWNNLGASGFVDRFGVKAPPEPVQQSYGANVNTHVNHQNSDVVGQHLLYETALLDSQEYELLSIDEVDSLKNEYARLGSRIEGAQRQLALETKLKDAAQNLQRLYSGKGSRPDTPQSPESPKASRSSFLRRKSRASADSDSLGQADAELAASVKKVDQLKMQVKQLFETRQKTERRLLKHTAAVLAIQAKRGSDVPVTSRKLQDADNDDDESYFPDDFDDIRDILRGKSAGDRAKPQHYEQQMNDLQDRLEVLNGQLRSVIKDAGQTLGRPVSAETQPDESGDSAARLENCMLRLQHNLGALEQQQKEAQMRNAKADELAQKSGEYESVMMGLWKVIQSSNDDDADSERNPQAFSLEAFNIRVKQIFEKCQGAKAQHDILKRQVQQQRNLNGQSDAQKDGQIADLQGRHDRLDEAHRGAQAECEAIKQDLANAIVARERAESEVQRAHSELENTMGEIETMKETIDKRQAERDDVKKQIAGLQAAATTKDAKAENTEDLESEVVRLTTELTMVKAELDGAYGSRAERAGAQAATVEKLQERNAAVEKELQGMTTEFQELTKASLDLEREREQLDSLIDSLRERCETLEQQLNDEKVRWMGKAPHTPNGAGPADKEPTSTMVMRHEFKRIVRDARAEGVKALRVSAVAPRTWKLKTVLTSPGRLNKKNADGWKRNCASSDRQAGLWERAEMGVLQPHRAPICGSTDDGPHGLNPCVDLSRSLACTERSLMVWMTRVLP